MKIKWVIIRGLFIGCTIPLVYTVLLDYKDSWIQLLIAGCMLFVLSTGVWIINKLTPKDRVEHDDITEDEEEIDLPTYDDYDNIKGLCLDTEMQRQIHQMLVNENLTEAERWDIFNKLS